MKRWPSEQSGQWIAVVTVTLVAMAASSLRAEVLIDEDFESFSGWTINNITATTPPEGRVTRWTGDTWGQRGMVDVDNAAGAGGSSSSLYIQDNTGANLQSALATFAWTDWWSNNSPTQGKLSIGFDMMIPSNANYDLETAYGAPSQMGGQGWSSPVTFRPRNGNFELMNDEGTQTFASYSLDQWMNIRFEFDLQARTVDIYVDETLEAGNVPWRAAATAAGLNEINLVGDFRERDEETFQPYIASRFDNMQVEYTPIPEPGSLLLLGFGTLVLARSRR